MVTAIEAIDKKVSQKRSNKHCDVKLNSLSLTAAQRETTYRTSNMPQDPGDHPSGNELLNNGEIEDINTTVVVVESK
jgi:hypothetical protein